MAAGIIRAGFLPVGQPLDLRATLASGQVFRWEWEGEQVWGVIGGDAYGLRQEQDGLSFCSSAPPAEAAAKLSAFLRLDDDLGAVRQSLAWDGAVAEAMARVPGLRLLRQDPWECLVSFVCSSASNIPRISRTLRALAEVYGEPVGLVADGERRSAARGLGPPLTLSLSKGEGPRGARLLHRFPTPGRLARAMEEELRGLGLGFRAEYVARLARQLAEGGIDLLALRQLPYQEAREELLRLPGVGEKVADCVLLYSLDKLEAFPVDRWVRRALEDRYGRPPKESYRSLLAWAQERWGRHAGYAQLYLFDAARRGRVRRAA